MRRHWLTTILGLIAGIGAILANHGKHLNMPNLQAVGQITEEVGIIALGAAAADSRKTTPSTKEKSTWQKSY